MVYILLFCALYVCVAIPHMKCNIRRKALISISACTNQPQLPKIVRLKSDGVLLITKLIRFVILGLGFVFCPWYYPVGVFVLEFLLFFILGQTTQKRCDDILVELYEIACLERMRPGTNRAKELLDMCNFAIGILRLFNLTKLNLFQFPIEVYHSLVELAKTEPENAKLVAKGFFMQYHRCLNMDENILLGSLADINYWEYPVM